MLIFLTLIFHIPILCELLDKLFLNKKLLVYRIYLDLFFFMIPLIYYFFANPLQIFLQNNLIKTKVQLIIQLISRQ